MLLQFGFSGSKAPFRGAIGWGDLIDDPAGIVLGSAIEDAYLGESIQAWAGAMLAEAARDFAETGNYLTKYAAAHEAEAAGVVDEANSQRIRNGAKRLVRYRVPTQRNPKDGPVTYSHLDTYAINWTIQMYVGASSKSFGPLPTDMLPRLQTILSSSKTGRARSEVNSFHQVDQCRGIVCRSEQISGFMSDHPKQ